MKNLIKHKQVDKIYATGFICLLLRLLFTASNLIETVTIIDSGLLFIFIVAMIWILVNQRMTKGKAVIVVIIGMICVYSYYKVHYYYLITTFLCMAASKNINLKYTLKWSCKIKIVYLSIHVFLYIIISIIQPNLIQYVYRDGVRRHYFFVSHANTFSMYLMWTIFEYLYLKYDVITRKQILYIWFIDMCLNYFSDSSTNMIIVTIVLSLVALKKRYPKTEIKWVHFAVKYGYFFCSIFFCGITICYQYFNGILKVIYNFLDDLLTRPLIYGAHVYSNYGITLFGKILNFPEKIFWNGYWFDFVGCDNTYIWCMLCYGSIYLVILSILFFLVEKKLSDIELIITLAYILYSITENYVINAVFCFPIILLGHYMLQTKVKTRVKTENFILKKQVNKKSLYSNICIILNVWR